MEDTFLGFWTGSKVNWGVLVVPLEGAVKDNEYLSGLGEGSNRDPKSTNSSAQIFALILALMRLPKGTAMLLNNGECGRTSPPDPLAICETSSCTAASTTLVGCTALVDCMAVRTAATMVDTSVSERLSSPVKAATACWGWISTGSGTNWTSVASDTVGSASRRLFLRGGILKIWHIRLNESCLKRILVYFKLQQSGQNGNATLQT